MKISQKRNKIVKWKKERKKKKKCALLMKKNVFSFFLFDCLDEVDTKSNEKFLLLV
jgi:hypothetical protein